MKLTKPPGIENDAFKSQKWDELTSGRRFEMSDVPTLMLLCQWHKIAQLAIDELDQFGEQTAYQNNLGDLKQFPQVGTLKTASAEIRQLNKQLGIIDNHEEGEDDGRQSAGILTVFAGGRAKRAARASNQD